MARKVSAERSRMCVNCGERINFGESCYVDEYPGKRGRTRKDHYCRFCYDDGKVPESNNEESATETYGAYVDAGCRSQFWEDHSGF